MFSTQSSIRIVPIATWAVVFVKNSILKSANALSKESRIISVLEMTLLTTRWAGAENQSLRIYFRYESKLTEVLCFAIFDIEQRPFFSRVKHTLNCHLARLDPFQRFGIQDQAVIRGDLIEQIVDPLISQALLYCDLMITWRGAYSWWINSTSNANVTAVTARRAFGSICKREIIKTGPRVLWPDLPAQCYLTIESGFLARTEDSSMQEASSELCCSRSQ